VRGIVVVVVVPIARQASGVRDRRRCRPDGDRGSVALLVRRQRQQQCVWHHHDGGWDRRDRW